MPWLETNPMLERHHFVQDVESCHWTMTDLCVRYGISRSPTELRIAPHHQFQYQWNIMASPEHLRTLIAHPHTGYLSCSTGIPPNVDPDLFDDPALAAYTQLNDGTPLVPLTQSWEVRRPAPVEVPIAGLNRIEDVLNTDPDFVLNDSRTRIEIVVPDDVVTTVVKSIVKVNQTGKAGDGKIFVATVDGALRVRTGEKNGEAIA